jgi:hypothetical protein
MERHTGGTLFQPFLDEAEILHPDLVIALTDGHNFESSPLKYSNPNSVIWVINKDGTTESMGVKSFGYIIKMNDNERKRTKYSW